MYARMSILHTYSLTIVSNPLPNQHIFSSDVSFWSCGRGLFIFGAVLAPHGLCEVPICTAPLWTKMGCRINSINALRERLLSPNHQCSFERLLSSDHRALPLTHRIISTNHRYYQPHCCKLGQPLCLTCPFCAHNTPPNPCELPCSSPLYCR